MLFNFQGEERLSTADTNLFGIRCFLTLGIEIIGKSLDREMRPWKDMEELIEFKSNMRKPPKNNVPIDIIKLDFRQKNNNLNKVQV